MEERHYDYDNPIYDDWRTGASLTLQIQFTCDTRPMKHTNT